MLFNLSGSLNDEAYTFTHMYKGVKELAGEKNNRLIVVAHHLTGCSEENPSNDVDSTIPWCSSWVNLAFVAAAIRVNPKKAHDMLLSKNFSNTFISEVFLIAGRPFDRWAHEDTNKTIIPPTWSAASKSWDDWGIDIPFNLAKRGDVVRFTRDGGGHVGFLDENELGVLFIRVLGGNQFDMVCSTNYAKSRLVCVRRAM